MNTVISHQDAKVFEDHLNKRAKAKEFYNLYLKEKSFLFRYTFSINFFLILVLPFTLAFAFSSLKPFTLSVLSFIAYFVVSARISDDIEKSFQREHPEKALLLFPKQ